MNRAVLLALNIDIHFPFLLTASAFFSSLSLDVVEYPAGGGSSSSSGFFAIKTKDRRALMCPVEGTPIQ
jgi:hypothetical protein